MVKRLKIYFAKIDCMFRTGLEAIFDIIYRADCKSII